MEFQDTVPAVSEQLKFGMIDVERNIYMKEKKYKSCKIENAMLWRGSERENGSVLSYKCSDVKEYFCIFVILTVNCLSNCIFVCRCVFLSIVLSFCLV